MNSADSNYLTATFYRFCPIDDGPSLQLKLRRACQANSVTGTILIANEGINGTLCGEPNGLRAVIAEIRSDSRFSQLETKESSSTYRTLKRLKVKCKPEIVALREPGVDARKNSGKYVEPTDWNTFISDPEVVVIDTRNHYEVSIGTFRNAVDPSTENFSDLVDWVDQNQQKLREGEPKIAMFCTGGIRCEKSTALLRSKGFENVYHLHGGILNYLEQIPAQDSLFEGECFVFDDRVSVKHDLSPGTFGLCSRCGDPVRAVKDHSNDESTRDIRCQDCLVAEDQDSDQPV